MKWRFYAPFFRFLWEAKNNFHQNTQKFQVLQIAQLKQVIPSDLSKLTYANAHKVWAFM